MIIKKNILFISFLIHVTMAYAQTQFVEGILRNSQNNQTIPYATVILHKSIDSTFISASATDSVGKFQLSTPSKENFYLQISHIEYNDTLIKILFDNPVGTIYLRPVSRQLDEVVVTANPTLRVKNGVLKYNTQILFKDKPVTNAYDMLEKLPGVYKISGKLSLIGVAGLTILINGKPNGMNQEQLTRYLQQIKSSEVKNIELMYNAPPEYHTKGGVINIITKQTLAEEGVTRLQGEVEGQYSIQHYSGKNGGGAIRYATHKLAVGINYKYMDMKERTGMDIYSYHDVSGTIHKVDQKNRGWIKNRSHTASIDLDYKSGKNALSASYHMQLTPNGNIFEGSKNNFSLSTNFSNKTKYLHNLSVNYIFNKVFKVGAYYTSYVNNSSQHFDALNNNLPESFISNAKQDLDIFDLYIDHKNLLKNEWTFSYGAKFKYTRDKDFQNYNLISGNKPVEDTNSKMNELITNLYASIEKSFTNSLTVSFSITGEYSKFTDDKDFAFFPQLNLSYVQSPLHTIQLSFSSNKTYPSYWERQKFIGFFDGYTQVRGNTALKPYNTYSANFTYLLKQKYIFSFYHINQPSFFAQQAYQAKDEFTLLYQTQNWKYNRTTGASIIIPFNIGKKFNSILTLNSFYQHARSDQFYDIRFDRSRFSHLFATDNTLRLFSKPAIALNLSGYYGVNMMHGIYRLSNPLNMDCGVKWSFWQGNATLVLRASDLFNNSIPDMKVNYAGQDFYLDLLSYSRSITISFNYVFGSYKKKQSNKIDTSRFK